MAKDRRLWTCVHRFESDRGYNDSMPQKPTVKFEKGLKKGTYPIAKLCSGIEKVAAVKKIFGKNTKRVISNLKVRIAQTNKYAYIDVKNGSIVLSQKYLKSADPLYLYLDMVHELVHIRQLHEGKELFDKNYAYVDRPTEIEAYKVASIEARRMGLKGKKLLDYIVVDWITKQEFERLLESIR